MNIVCKTCIGQEPIFKYIGLDTKDSLEKEAEHFLNTIHCLNCQSNETGVKFSSKPDGWHNLEGLQDHFIIYIMSQIIYNQTADDNEPLFDLPDPGDRVRILWNGGSPLGFYTVKPRGTFVPSTGDVYLTDTLDTAFVLPSCRRKGLGVSMLSDFVTSTQGEDIAFSSPISTSMAHVISKFLQLEPSYRMKIWEIEGAGSQGSRKLLYYTLKNKLR